MAPLTRGSVNRNPGLTTEGSWQFAQIPEPQDIDDQSDSELEADPFTEDNDVSMASPTPSFRVSSHDPLPALQHTAERVSRQVEDFAKSLDQYCSHKPDASSVDTWKQARHLVKTYQGAVEKRIHNVTQSSKHNKLKRKSALPQEQEDELQACELEADTWDIVYSLLELQDPASKAQVEEAQKTAFDGLHRYSTDGQIWDAFLNSDSFAQECYTILLWLQRTAARSRPPIEDVIAEKAAQAERGEGIWSAGWLYTKSAIKNTKRMRSWPKPLDPNAPGLQATLRGMDDKDDIVSQLDPDAVTRQRHSLVSSDRYHEKASWQACWEMLRRGSQYTEVEDWWKERKESWRAASILGASLRPEVYTADAGISWMISLPRKVRSRAMTALANADVNLDEHEAAVYGLLCSKTQASLGVCSMIDDYLFVYFSNLLLNCYHRFCEMYHEKAYSQKRVHLQPTAPQYDLINQVLHNSQTQAKTKAESQVPSKFVQAAIVSKQYNSFFVRIGKALSILAHRAGGSTLIYVDKEVTADESAMAAAEDPEALRIIAHLYVLLKTLGQVNLHGTDDQLAQNCISGYIAVLREEAKMEMIPLYIAHISSLRRRAQTLGTVLIDITDPSERQLQANLLKKYQLDIGPVLLVMFKTLYYKKKESSDKGFFPVHLVEYAGAGKLKSFRVKADFIEAELTNDEELLIRSLEWYQYTDPKKEWQHCCTVATALYIHFITKGRLAAAKALLSRASLASLSQSMTKINLALADDIEDSEDEYDGEPDGLPAEERSKSVSPSKSRRRPSSGAMSPPDISQMRQQAQTWRELEELVGIFEALDGWSAIATETEKHREDKKRIASSKNALNEALDTVKSSTYPIFSPNYLNLPLTPDEAEPLTTIRNFYLPEIILAYHAVLHLAGHYLTRDHLTECMDLATEVATLQELSDVLMAAGRMGEFVEQCAISAKALLFANEQGGSKSKKKKAGVAGNSEIWQVKSTSKTLQEQLAASKKK